MKTTFATLLTATGALAAPPSAFAVEPDRALFNVGITGSYTELKFQGGNQTSTTDVPEGGLVVGFGNTLTAREGLVYNAEASARYASKDQEHVRDAQADFALGWQWSLGGRHYLSALAGGGYKWDEFEPEERRAKVTLTSRTPFVKLAAAYVYRADATTIRVVAGVRRIVDGDARLEVSGAYDDRVDLRDQNAPYAELTALFNQQARVPILASVYYTQYKYRLSQPFPVSSLGKQTRDEYGAKLSIAF